MSETTDTANAKETEPVFIQKYGIPYYASIVLFAVYIGVAEWIGKSALTVLIVYILQYVGRLLANDDSNLSSKHVKYHNAHFYHSVPMLLNVFGTWGVLAYSWVRYEYLTRTTEQAIFCAQALGLVFSSSLNAAHQLFHKKPLICQVVGCANMCIVLFTVYPIQHVYYHHKNVGTSKDPIMSPKNFNLYFYTLRVLWTAHKFTYQYSKKIFAGCMAMNAAYVGCLYFLALRQYGDSSLALNKTAYFVIVGLVGLFILEIVEYIEHYGLIFSEDKQGKKQIRQLSSWNSQRDPIFNWLAFRYQRHSGHHVDSYKYYSTVDLTPNMPRFKFSFFQGMLLALIPPLWYYIMNPYVDQQTLKKKVNQKHDSIVKIIKESVYFLMTVNLIMKLI